jgi:hypothetical protein
MTLREAFDSAVKAYVDFKYCHKGFDTRVAVLRNKLRYGKASIQEVTPAINDLLEISKGLPVVIIREDIWGKRLGVLVKTHLHSTFEDAVANVVTATGRALTENDEHYLGLLLTHWCGWSATYREHMDPLEPWMVFFQLRYPHLQDLRLILDSLTYPEEVENLPEGYQPLRPELFLLATPERYYVYDCTAENDGLFEAGPTLKDVYRGMKEWRFLRVEENRWPVEKVITTVSQQGYFPEYYREPNGKCRRI